MLNPEQDFKEHIWPYESSHRGAGVGGKFYNQPYLSELTVPGVFWEIEGEPYSRAPGTDFA